MSFSYLNDRSYCLSAVPSDCLEVIFEGAVFSDCSSFVDAHYDRVNDTARKQMKSVQAGAQTTKWKAHKDRYGMQTAQIIEGFTLYEGQEQVLVAQDKHNTRKRSQGKKTASAAPAEDLIDAADNTTTPVTKQVPGMFGGAAGVAANWKMGMTSLVNGVGYQHPHSDAGRPDSYKGLKIFPFVTIHGFGLDAFSMWLLPDPFSNTSKYGFLHTFKPHQMLFMRGDFVHAGVPSPIPRGHMKFFPSAEAGWNQDSSFWHRKGAENVTFLWQGYHPPFGYPCIGTPDLSGKQIVSYPVTYTKLLRYPWTQKQCDQLGTTFEHMDDKEKAARTALKRKAVASLALCVYNV
jgi:hypothetical protein